MKIVFYTNLVYGGWSPKDLEVGIGGSEEKLIELARELAKKHDVTVYMNGEQGDFDGVKYRDHREFKPWEKLDAFVSFKARGILAQSINADKIIHWSTEIEPEWKAFEKRNVDKILTISDYHAGHFTNNDKVVRDYLWMDTGRLDKNKTKKVKGTMLYSSSLDRGLEELLSVWGTVKDKLNLDKLYITYGWDFIDKLIKADPRRAIWKENMLKLMEQEGVEMVGRLSNNDMSKKYWECEYWVLPLNNPQAELFCINAIKAQYCGAIPVVRSIGALPETVNEFIDFDHLLGQKASQDSKLTKSEMKKVNREHASKFNINDAMQRWDKHLT